MSKFYTPGLKVLRNTQIFKERILPLKGRLHVKLNEVVASNDIVASTELPGNVQMINVANEFNIEPKQVLDYMLYNINDYVLKGQIIAKRKGIFGLFSSEIKSPIEGTIINISKITGQVILSEKPLSIEVDAYIPGTVNKIIDKEGVIVNSNGTFIQGILGIAGENQGILKILVNSFKDNVMISQLDDSLKDMIIVCGSFIDFKIYEHASKIGVKGIVCGGIDYNDISKIIKKPLGVAITGTENTMNLILTEGFGKIDMAKKTFEILKENDGNIVSINGATQIRAGVLRPEIFIHKDSEIKNEKIDENQLVISEGSIIRVIREPFFGKIGEVISLPSKLVMMKSETKVRVAEIKFQDDQQEIIPRANLEVILSD